MRSSQSPMKKLLRVASHDSMQLAKVTAIKEAKDLATLPLDELVCNLKVYEMILENNSVVSKTTTKEKVKSLALKAKVTREQTSDDSDSQGVSAAIDFVMVPIGLLETVEIALGTKSVKAQNKKEFATIARSGATLLVLVLTKKNNTYGIPLSESTSKNP
ncbi:hypothetical protein Tco_1119595 [Tanacetum coccineum]